MEEINDFLSRFNESLLLWISGLIAAVFIFLIVFDSIRRRRRRRARFAGRERSSRSNSLKRAAASLRTLRQELGRRSARKGRRRDRRK
jgi:flagellar biosynthesis/type III secretory pathway M-ring protein FliF/YscJ